MSCINLNDLAQSLEKIKYTVQSNEGKIANKDIRFETSDIPMKAILDVLQNGEGKFNDTESVKDRMTNMFYKLKGIRYTLSNPDTFNSIPELFKSNNDKSIAVSLGLSEVIEAVRGEVFKGENLNVPMDKFSSKTKDELAEVRVPFARVAATLGRQIMASRTGMIFGINDSSKMSGEAIEQAYQTIGEAALQTLADNNYIKISDKGTVINDFRKDDSTTSDTRGKAKDQTIAMKSISLNLDTEGSLYKEYGKGPVDSFVKFLHSAGKTDPTEMSYAEGLQEKLNWSTSEEATEVQEDIKNLKHLDALQLFLSGIKRIAVPSTFVDVKLDSESIDNKRNTSEPYSEEFKEGMKSLNETKQHIKQPFLNFFKHLAEKYQEEERPLRGFFKNSFTNSSDDSLNPDDLLNTMFGLYSKDIDTSYSDASIVGKNTSILSPLEDILGHMGSLMDENGLAKIFFNSSHIGANVRDYYDAAYMSIQSNKLIRDIVGVGEKEEKTFNIDEDKKAFTNLLTYLVDAMPDEAFSKINEEGKDTESLTEEQKIKAILGNEDTPESNAISQLIDHVDNLTSENPATTIEERLTALYNINYYMNGKKKIKNPSFMHNASIISAIKNIRAAVNSKDRMLTTDFLVDPDASANGATLKLGEAIGTPKAKEILEQVGVAEDANTENKLNSIYDYINKKIITPAIEVTTNKTTQKTKTKNKIEIIPKGEVSLTDKDVKTIELLEKVIYKGNMRNFAKLPAIPLIYGQGKIASIKTIAEGIAEAIGVEFNGSKADELTDGHKEVLGLLGEDKDKTNPNRITSKDVENLVKLFSKKNTGIATKVYGLMAKEFFSKPDGALTAYSELSKNVFSKAEDIFNEGSKSEHFSKKLDEQNSKVQTLKANLSHVNNQFKIIKSQKKKVNKKIWDNLVSEQTKAKEDLDMAKKELQRMVTLKDHFMMAPPISDNMETDAKTMFANPKIGFKLEKAFNVYNKDTGTITVKKLPQFTVFDVSGTHMIDSNNQITTGGHYLNLYDAKFLNAKDAEHQIDAYSDKMAKNMKEYNKVQALLHAATEYANLFYEKGSKEHTKALADIQKQQDVFNEKFAPALKEAKINTDAGVLFGEKPVNADTIDTNKSNNDSINATKSEEGIIHLETLDEGEKTPIINAFLKLQKDMNVKVTVSDKGSNKFVADEKGSEILLNTKESELTGGNIKDKSELQELASHEILHSFTSAWLSKDGIENTTEYKYLKLAIPKLQKLVNDNFRDGTVGENAYDRLAYVFKEFDKNPKVGVAELISILGAEPKAAKEIYKMIDNSNNIRFSTRLKNIIVKAVKKIMTHLSLKAVSRLERDGLNIEDLNNAVNAVINQSIVDIKQDSKSFKNNTIKSKKELGPLGYSSIAPQGLLPRLDNAINRKLNYINHFSERVVTNPLEHKAKIISKNIDTMLEGYPTYLRAKSAALDLYNGSDTLQQLAEYVRTPDKLINRKANVLTMSDKVSKETQERTNEALNQIHHLTKDFTKEGKKTLSDITSTVPLQYMFEAYPELGKAKEFKDKLTELEATTAKSDLKFLEDLTTMLVEGEVVDSRFGSVDDKYGKGADTSKFKAILALKTLEKVDPEFKNMENLAMHNSELYTIIKDNSMALHLMHKELTNDRYAKDIQVTPHYEKLIQKRIFKWENRNRYQYEDSSGWKILQEATKEGKVGIAYRELIDKHQAQGAGIDVQLPTQDLTVPSSYITDGSVDIHKSNIVKFGNEYRVILKPDQHTTMSKITNPGESLVRSTTNMIHLRETEGIRNLVVQEAYTMKIDDFSDSSKQLKELNDLIQSDTIDHPWFLKVPEDMDYSKASAEIKAKYKPIQVKLSDVNDFNKKVSWVRKDIAHWLTGYNKGPLFQSKMGQKMTRVVKNVVSLAKINMAIVNPKKIALDAASSVNQLTIMGVPLSYNAKHSKAFLDDVKTYKETKKEMALLQLKLFGNPNNKLIQAKLDKLEDSIKDNEMNKAAKLGFVNSLSSDIVSSNSQTRYGLSADVDKVLEKVLLNKGGETNAIGKRIVALSKVGFDGTAVLNRLADYIEVIPGVGDKLKGIHEALDEMEKIKDEEDVVGMMRQWTLSPNSEFVKAGIETNDLIDATSKYTYYVWLTEEQGYSHEDAIKQVVKAIPDYKENMPSMVKLLSDYFILPFPSFNLRTVLSQYMMFKERPASVITFFGIESALGTDLESIIGTGPTRISSPLDAVGSGFIYPNNIFNY